MAHKTFWIANWALLLVISAPPVTSAQTPSAPVTELSLDQLLGAEVPMVVGASRFAQHVTDAPAAITIVTREEIERFGYRSMAELLRSVRGFYVTYDRNYTYLGTRGLSRSGDYNSRVLFLVDGHRVNDNVYDGAYIGTEFPIDPEWIERVEIVRGPSSSLYGTSAFFAVVNVITRQGIDVNGARATADIGSLGSRRAAGSYGQLFENGAQVLVAGSRYRSSGQSRIEYPTLGVVASGMDHDDALKLFASVARGPWRAQFSHASREKMIPTGAYGVSFDDPRSATQDARGFVNLKYDGRVGGVSLMSRVYYDWYLYDGTYAYGLDTPAYEDEARGQWWGVESVVSRRQSRHLLTGGVELRQHFQQDQTAFYEDAPTVFDIEDRRESRQWAAFVQDEVTISPRFIVNAGVRYDHYGTFGGTTNPRAAIIFKPRPAGAIKLLYGTAFRAPNNYELYYYGNEDLEPEKIHTTELVAERYGPKGRVAATAFRYNLGGLITQQETGFGLDELAFINADDISVSGLEVEGERMWSRAWQTLVSFTFQRPNTDLSSARLSNSPRQLARLRVSGPLFIDRLTFGVEGLFTGTRQTVDGTESEAFGVANFTVRTARPFAGLTLAWHVDNVFDRAYDDPGGEEQPVSLIRQDGRTMSLTASWKF